MRVLFLLVMVASAPAVAQEPQGARVRAVVIQRDAVFDSIEAKFWPWRLANAVHAETRESVVRRELLIDVGDRYDSALVAESERNLRALGVFRDVQILDVVTDSGLVLFVRTADAWTTTLGLGLATSGTQSVLDLSVQEGNLLGTRTFAQVAYRNDPDRSSITAAFDSPRAIDHRIGVAASLVERSDGRARTASMRLPFLNLSSRAGGSVSAIVAEGRVLQFANGAVRDEFWRASALVRGDAAVAITAGPRGFVRAGLLGQWRRDDQVPYEDRDRVSETRTAAAGLYVSARVPRFIRVRNMERIGRVEDLDLGVAVTATALAAPRAWGYEQDGVGLSLGTNFSLTLPRAFVRMRLTGAALLTGEGTDSATVDGSATFVSQPGLQHLIVLHGSGGQLRRPVPGREFDLGLGTGVRAFPAHAFTGDRYFILSGEYRLLLAPRLFGLVGVGVAAFGGTAGAWYNGEPSRRGTEFGAGLRLASIREAGSVWRLDVARRLAAGNVAAGWVASVGRGFVFGGI
jgi:hypothetical protein